MIPKLCLCSICRKVGGTGGSINLGGHTKTLKVDGKENLKCAGVVNDSVVKILSVSSVYNAVLDRDTPQERRASSERNFCKHCSSMLWVYDKEWFVMYPQFMRVKLSLTCRPELIHPFASSIDYPKLETPETMVRR